MEKTAAAAATIDAEQRMLEEQSLCYECTNYHRGCNHASFLTTGGLKKHSEGCKYREGQPTMIIQERAELRGRLEGLTPPPSTATKTAPLPSRSRKTCANLGVSARRKSSLR
jgi:hypothetical protein